MTVLQRLAKKSLVVQHRDDRAHRYAPTHGRDELVAGLMVDALDQASDSGSREAALVSSSNGWAQARPRRYDEPLPNSRPRTVLARPLAIRVPPEGHWSVSALAFSIVALLLIGPVPALLARASWPLRAPRAAIVLWQSIALAAVLSAFSAGIAVAAGSSSRPGRSTTATITSEIRVLGWPLWLLYIVVFALTLLVGARLVVRRPGGGRHAQPPRAPPHARRPPRQGPRLVLRASPADCASWTSRAFGLLPARRAQSRRRQ